MSDLYNSLYRELEPDRFGKADDGPDPLKLAAGLAFEAYLERVLQGGHEEIQRPGEFTVKVQKTLLTFSPDLLIFNGTLRVGEIKWTWMSSKGAPEHPKFDKWFTQMKAYCHHLGTRLARLYVYFACGDYTYPLTPQFHVYDTEFTPQELQENWDMLVNHGIAKGLL